MRKVNGLVVLLLLFLSTTAMAQRDECLGEYTFKSGEYITYRAVYNWGFIWLNAGDVFFSVSDTVYKGKKALHLVSKGWSLKEYDWFFKVRDRFESIIDTAYLKPYWFERETLEGGFETYNRYVFDHEKGNLDIISKTSKRAFKRDVRKLTNCTFDVLSAIYYCRNLDFDNRKPNEKIPLRMAIDNDVYDLYLRYKGKEVLELRNGEKYNTIKLSAMLVEGTIFKGGEDLTVWVTDDKNRIPVLVEAKILVGSVKAVITGATGYKYPSKVLKF